MENERRREYDPTRCKWHQKSIDKFDEILTGDGKPGLIEDVAVIKAYVRITTALLVPTVLAIIGILIAIFKLI